MSQETVDRAPQADTGFDEVAAYYEGLNSQRRRQVAAFLGLTSTASEEVVDYAVDMHQKLFEKQKAEELAAKAIAIKEEAIRDKWVVPNQRDLRPELSEKLTRLYYDDQHPSTRMMPDPLF